MAFKDPREQAKVIVEKEYLENPNDPTDKDWDTALDASLNGIDPELFREGKGTLYDNILYDIEQNGGVGTFFDDRYPNGIPYNKVSDSRKEYMKKKINDLVNTKYKYLAEFL